MRMPLPLPFRSLGLVMLALVLALRMGPLCEPAAATVPAPVVATADCHQAPQHAPEPDEDRTAKPSCLTPCATLAPGCPQPVAVAAADAVRVAVPHRPLDGLAAAPDLPPPRRG